MTNDFKSASSDEKTDFLEIERIVKSYNLTEYKVLDFKKEYIKFTPYNIKFIPENACSILCFAFPYYSGQLDIENIKGERNISIYSAVPDYHKVIGNIFSLLISDFKKIFNRNNFYGFADNSPFNELQIGLLSGLGVLGKNQLILNSSYGSYIFIGVIATDLKLKETKKPEKYICIDCKKCIDACPTSALLEDGLIKKKCLSFITQKKGVLEKEEERFIKQSKIIWGCDICQQVCPYNKNPKETKIIEFKKDIILKVDYDTLITDYKERSFGFRGSQVLRRNLDILMNNDIS